MKRDSAFFTRRMCTGAALTFAGIALAAALNLPARAQVIERSRSDTGVPAARDFGGTWDRAPTAAPPGQGAAAPAPGGIAGATLPSGGPPARTPEAPLKEPYLTQYRTQQRANQEAEARGEPVPSEGAQCLPQGMPAMMTAIFPMEVLQTRGQLTIIQEAFNQVRRIYIDEEPVKIEDAEPGFFGHSTAKWEGDTLVVDTVGIKESVRANGVPHSSEMRIRERFRKIDADHFEDEVTVTDPDYLTAPWVIKHTYRRRPDYRMYEYVCEDNREFADPVTGQQRLRLGDGSE
jgi:hypothetical protein